MRSGTRPNELRDAGYVEVSTLNGRNLYSTTPEGAALVCPEFAGEEEQSESPSLHTLVVSSVVTRYMNAGFDVVTERELRRAGAEGGYAVVSSERKHHHPDAVALAGGWGLDLAIEVELTRGAATATSIASTPTATVATARSKYWALSQGMQHLIQRYATRYGAEDLVEVASSLTRRGSWQHRLRDDRGQWVR